MLVAVLQALNFDGYERTGYHNNYHSRKSDSNDGRNLGLFNIDQCDTLKASLTLPQHQNCQSKPYKFNL